jgi:regulator of CtrA degradation
MHIIAWLLTQRAVEAGELSLAQARRPVRRLGDAAESDIELLAKLPPGAIQLIDASRELYSRVRRLDDSAAQPASSPARSLMNRLERSL